MVFSSRKMLSINLSLNNVEIEKAHTCKYLGIYLDDQLSYKHHGEKLVKFTRIFYRLRSKISSKWLRNIYYCFVYPQLLYGIEMYANTCVTYLDKLIKLNSKILRILHIYRIAPFVLTFWSCCILNLMCYH